MKKLFAMIMILCLLCSAVALAEDALRTPDQESDVVFNNPRRETFTVTIPARIQLNADGDDWESQVKGTLNIQLDTNDVNVPDSWVEVRLKGTKNAESGANFLLKNGEDIVSYNVLNSDESKVYIGDTVLRWDFDTTGNFFARKELTVQADSLGGFWMAGDYTDTLTFEIRSEMP